MASNLSTHHIAQCRPVLSKYPKGFQKPQKSVHFVNFTNYSPKNVGYGKKSQFSER